MINTIRQRVKENRPLIHCITNPISINQCANTILATGARPMMAEHPAEAPVITQTAAALMLNLGNLNPLRMESMMTSAVTAKTKVIPFVLDVCGCACLENRRYYALNLIKNAMPAVIKGNYSEIKALADSSYSSSGVDADTSLTEADAESAALILAQKFRSVILASGRTDIIVGDSQIARIRNGSPQLSTITGTGCMLGALCAAYLSAGKAFDAAVTACTVMGICGQLAETDKGSGSFSVGLFDALSTITDEDIEKYKDLEVSPIE